MVTYILFNGGSWKVKATVEVSLSEAAFFILVIIASFLLVAKVLSE